MILIKKYNNLKYGFVNEKDDVVIPYMYDEVYPFTDNRRIEIFNHTSKIKNYSLVRKNDEWFFIDEENTRISNDSLTEEHFKYIEDIRRSLKLQMQKYETDRLMYIKEILVRSKNTITSETTKLDEKRNEINCLNLNILDIKIKLNQILVSFNILDEELNKNK